MSVYVIALLVAVGALALMMAGLGMKMLLHKEEEFRRPCANADPKTGRCANCTCDLKRGGKGKNGAVNHAVDKS